MFENMPQVNVPQTAYVKRRRLITTEMARSRVESGEWQLRSMEGHSVRCRFFFELYDGEVPLNTLSCKICGATYSVQSRSHYREHVRRRHSEVYCVRGSRAQLTKDSILLDNLSANSSALFGGDDSMMDADSPYGASSGDFGDGEPDFDCDEEEDGGFSLPFNNDNSLAGTEADEDGVEELGDGSSPCRGTLICDVNGDQMPQLNAAKARRLATTDTATVLHHLESGDWQKRNIPGVSIRSRFFVEIVEGDKTLNILLCKACGSTYSAQSRSHCVEHVKKRHQSILQGIADDPEFEYDLWMETRRPSPSALQQISVSYTMSNDALQPACPSTSTLAARAAANRKTSIVRPKIELGTPLSATSVQTAAARKRKRFPVSEIITGPDETIETPSFEDVLQTIASHVMLNGSGDEEMKFNLDDFSKTLHNGIAGTLPSADTGSEARDAKRQLLDTAPGSSCDGTASPPHITGGINDQLFALSEMAEAEEQRKAKEEADAAAAKVSSVNGNSPSKPPTLENALSLAKSDASTSAISNSNNKLSRLCKNVANSTSTSPLSSENGQKMMAVKINSLPLARPIVPLQAVKKTAIAGSQKLNHQQLLMASRTAALLSGNSDDAALDGGEMSPRENGYQSVGSRFRGRDNKDFYEESNGYFAPFSNSLNCGGNHHDHPFASSYARQQQGASNQYSQHHVKSQQSNYWSARQQHNIGAHQSGSHAFDEDLNGRNSSGGPRSNGSQHSTGRGAVETECVHDAAFCQSCKSEFPNVIKGLNQLYGGVKDLTDVLRQALSQPTTADALRNNSPLLSRTLRRLDAVAQAGSSAVQTFVATAARHGATTLNSTQASFASQSKLMSVNSKRVSGNGDFDKLAKLSESASSNKSDVMTIEKAPSLQRMDCDGTVDEVEECEEVFPDQVDTEIDSIEKPDDVEGNEENEIVVLSENGNNDKAATNVGQLPSAEKLSDVDDVAEVADDDEEDEIELGPPTTKAH